MADYAQALTFSVGAIIAIIVISNPISTSAIFIINGIKDILPDFMAIVGGS